MKTDLQQSENKCERGGNALWTGVSSSRTSLRSCSTFTRVGVNGLLAYVLTTTHPLNKSRFMDSGRTISRTPSGNFF